MDLLFAVCVLLFALGGVLKIIGASNLANKLMLTAIILLIIIPFVLCLLRGVFPAVPTPSSWWLLLLLIPLLIGWVRFTNHKRAYQDWMSRDEKLSLKRRLEND